MSPLYFFVGTCIIHSAIYTVQSAVCPDVYVQAAQHDLTIEFESATVSVRKPTNTISKSNARNQPQLIWPVEEDQKDDLYYTALMVDPDAPSHATPKMSEWLHWLVVNVPNGGDHIGEGSVIKPYAPPTPPRKTGEHRYCVYVFEQQEGYDPNLSSLTYSRPHFSTKDFVNSNANDFDLIAANSFKTHY
eukprot:236702_1